MNDKLEELEARIDGLSLALGVALRSLPHAAEIQFDLHRSERDLRRLNAHAALIEELVAIRGALRGS